MIAMILAAGLGNRMRPLTDHTPKPLLAVAGKPLLQYHLEALARAGITEVVINTSYLAEQIHAFVQDGSRFGLKIHCSLECSPLETGGALLHARKLLGNQPLLLINGDVWCDIDLASFSQQPLSGKQQGQLLLVANPSFHPNGDFLLHPNGQLMGDTHPHAAECSRYTFGGISLLHPSLVYDYPQQRPCFGLGEVLRAAIEQERLRGQIHRGRWCDVGTPERLAQLDASLIATPI
jgi:MurNAc alpha-1-phosphate uridylyltransferase